MTPARATAVVLVHGFASTVDHNWGGTGWIAALSQKYRVIAPDVRGHGLSDKPHVAQAYGYASMGADVTRLMDHLGIERALLMGYSMGASIAIELMLSRPEALSRDRAGRNRVRRRPRRQSGSRRDCGGLPRRRSRDDKESGRESVPAICGVDA